MTGYIAPHLSGAHRAASTSLFRALLSRCRRVDLPAEQKSALQNVARNRFRGSRHEQSKRVLAPAFNAGYEAITLLDEAIAGKTESVRRIQSLLDRTPGGLKAPPTLPQPRQPPRPKHPGLNPDSSSILSRPRLHVAGRRRIPRLVSANKFPMLRVKKPEPHHLTVYLRKKVDKRSDRHILRETMREMAALGDLEDRWDGSIRDLAAQEGQLGVVQLDDLSPSWSTSFRSAVTEISRQLADEITKTNELAKKMQRVILEEKRLLQAEKDERRRKAAVAEAPVAKRSEVRQRTGTATAAL